MILYRGGLEAIRHPDTLHSRKAVDFGSGFYLTPLRKQALQWCGKKKRTHGSTAHSIYTFDTTQEPATSRPITILTSYNR